jgi:D-3-phosphoglycerate dehydrogenase
MDKVDGPAAQAAGIVVRNVPDYCTDEVSDHALALLLAAERRIVPLATATARSWKVDRALIEPIRRLRGQTLGILGAGRIGRLVARKARAFGFVTIAHDPVVSDVGEPELELVTLDELLERSDALVLCAALTPSSRGIIDEAALARVRRGVIIVNVARGELIDELALADAVQDGRVGYAALDVRSPEPPEPADDPLAGLPNVVWTPHVAATSRDAIDDLHHLAARYVLELLEAAGRIPAVA